MKDQPPPPCVEEDCKAAAHSRGMCASHYGYWWRANRDDLVATAVCEECGAGVALRAAGRMRKFCSRRCSETSKSRRYRQQATCPSCKGEKPTSRWLCVSCTKRKTLQRRMALYGLTLERAEQMLSEQDGRCVICTVAITFDTLHVDHDHKCCDNGDYPGGKWYAASCGKCVRGFLCPGCNVALGSFRDDADRMEAAARYIRAWNAQ